MGGNLAPELKRLLSEAGCRFERHGKGDHDIWFSPHTVVRFPVDQKIKSRHTANAVLKQAGLPKQF
ncbi:MAG: type II toxin-antitoxin system HicA family toxin [Sulfuricellaceae bacterium]|nr:type II toxin-antitoxin system HicA family toxin [Sulfuricellaceae bacterium]